MEGGPPVHVRLVVGRAVVGAAGSLRDDDGVEIATVAERPELTELAWERTRDTLPEYTLRAPEDADRTATASCR